jgi:hypothetical protein
MPHQLLQGRNPHMFIGLMGAKGVSEGVDADLFAEAGLFHIFGNDILTDRCISSLT